MVQTLTLASSGHDRFNGPAVQQGWRTVAEARKQVACPGGVGVGVGGGGEMTSPNRLFCLLSLKDMSSVVL
ncbi:hypothetical protein GW17_00036918 [Ensete ventricosum]|nr:hypothetical protein GW17_00036918 [Ensete ventricosum]RZS03975.1 hypothetical protein BHM03_00034237 [Ensete ventricosum]